MKHVYIDLGCYDGDSVEQFRNWRKLAFNPAIEWEIHAFDPNPAFKEEWDRIKDDSTFFYQKAAWVKDGEVLFAIDTETDGIGSTAMTSKKAVWDSGQITSVPCFDFSEWLQQFKGCFVVLKMDIEGAEFPILEKMIADNTDEIVGRLMVEFHANKVSDYTSTDVQNLLAVLRRRGVSVVEWH